MSRTSSARSRSDEDMSFKGKKTAGAGPGSGPDSKMSFDDQLDQGFESVPVERGRELLHRAERLLGVAARKRPGLLDGRPPADRRERGADLILVRLGALEGFGDGRLPGLQRQNNGQRRIAVAEVHADRLAQPLLVAGGFPHVFYHQTVDSLYQPGVAPRLCWRAARSGLLAAVLCASRAP